MALVIVNGNRIKSSNTSCCRPSVSYSIQPVSASDSFSLPVQHRIKPESVWGVCTPLAKQWKRMLDAQVVQKTTSQEYWCTECGSITETINSWGYKLPTVLYPTVKEPNWALALRNKIQDDKVSFAESIGEWKESIRLLQDAGGVMYRSSVALKQLWRARKSRRKLARWFKRTFGRRPGDKYELMDAVQVDLAIKFGIKPLCQQIEDTVKQLDRYLTMARRIQVTLKKDSKASVPGTYGGENTFTLTRSVRAIAYVRYDAMDRSFTTGNLGEALWAGTRLSFMVDWFWNFGSYLSSFNAMQGVTSFNGVRCVRDTIRGIDSRISSRDYRVVTPGKWIESSYERTIISTLPLASLPSVSIPTTDIWGRLISSLEVFASLRKSAAMRR